jgi:hypothetical protein
MTLSRDLLGNRPVGLQFLRGTFFLRIFSSAGLGRPRRLGGARAKASCEPAGCGSAAETLRCGPTRSGPRWPIRWKTQTAGWFRGELRAPT